MSGHDIQLLKTSDIYERVFLCTQLPVIYDIVGVIMRHAIVSSLDIVQDRLHTIFDYAGRKCAKIHPVHILCAPDIGVCVDGNIEYDICSYIIFARLDTWSQVVDGCCHSFSHYAHMRHMMCII